MNILVCVKQTFSTAEKITIRDRKVIEDGVEFVLNPYDEYAVEEAIRLKERLGGTVTAVTIGPPRAEQALRTALALGADRALIIDDSSLPCDEYTVSRLLAAVAAKESYDLILLGCMSVDDASSQIGPRVAELLDIPFVSTIVNLELNGSTVIVEKDVEGSVLTIETTLPVVLTAQQGLNDPRYPSLPGIMKAKKKPLERLSIEALGLSAGEVKPKVEVVDQFVLPAKAAGKVLKGDIDTQVRELSALLRNEAKVI